MVRALPHFLSGLELFSIKFLQQEGRNHLGVSVLSEGHTWALVTPARSADEGQGPGLYVPCRVMGIMASTSALASSVSSLASSTSRQPGLSAPGFTTILSSTPRRRGRRKIIQNELWNRASISLRSVRVPPSSSSVAPGLGTKSGSDG